MKKFVLASAFVVVLASPGFAQSVGEKAGVNSTLGIAPKTEDFVTELAISDMFEIGSSKLAQTRAEGGSKSFTAQMVADHTKSTAELKSMIASGKVKAEPPRALDSSHQSKLDKLKTLRGDEFTKQYNTDQVAAHKDAVNLFERYAKGGENDSLKAFAETTLPTLKHHLEMAQSLGK